MLTAKDMSLMVSSAIVGTSIGFMLGKYFSDKKMKEEYEADIKAYRNLLRQYKERVEKAEVMITQMTINNEPPTEDDVLKPEDLTHYKDIAKEYSISEATEEPEETIESIWDQKVSEETELGTERIIHDEPYIINEDDFTLNDYEKFSIQYFEEDDVVADDRDQLLPDADALVGFDNLHKPHPGLTIIHIRNDQIEADFEVAMEPSSYSKVVLGYDPDDTPSGPKVKKMRSDYDD